MHRAALLSPLLLSLLFIAPLGAQTGQAQTTQATPPATNLRLSPLGSPKPSSTVPSIFTMAIAASDCPVVLRAQPGVNSSVMIIKAGDGAGSQSLNFQLTNSRRLRAITRAQITVHGLSAHPRLTLAGSGVSNAGELDKQVDLALQVAPGANTSADLLFQGMTSVSSIDLDALTFSDGSSWRSRPQNSCHIVPERTMLVASH